MLALHKIEQVIQTDQAAHPDTQWGVAIHDHDGQLVGSFGADTTMNAASFNKLSAAYAILRTETPLDTDVTLQDSDRPAGPEGGAFGQAPEGFTCSLGEVAYQALSRSDNTALRMVVRTLGGPSRVNDILWDERTPNGVMPVHVAYTRLGQPNPNDHSAEARFSQGVTTPRESGLLLKACLRNEWFWGALSHSNFGSGLRGVIDPKAVSLPKRLLEAYDQRRGNHLALLDRRFRYSDFPGKEGTVVDHEEHLRHHAARIGSYTVSVMTESSVSEPKGPEKNHHARLAQGKIGAIIRKAA